MAKKETNVNEVVEETNVNEVVEDTNVSASTENSENGKKKLNWKKALGIAGVAVGGLGLAALAIKEHLSRKRHYEDTEEILNFLENECECDFDDDEAEYDEPDYNEDTSDDDVEVVEF